MNIEQIRSTLYRISEYLTWVKDGMPYSMVDSDEYSYLASARNMAWNLAKELEDEPEETNADNYDEWRCRWTKCEGRKHRRIGYRYLVKCENGVIGVATYKGREQWEGYKGFKFNNVTHFAWLPKSDTAK
jgi:hypothetical protein